MPWQVEAVERVACSAGGKSFTLAITQGTTIDRLLESLTRADLSSRVEELYVHTDSMGAWKHMSVSLIIVMSEKSTLVEDSSAEV